MPVEVESTSQVEEFLRVLKRRIWWILVPFAIIATLGTSFAVMVPKKYVARTRILVREVRNRNGQVIAGSEGQGRVAKHLIRSPNRVRSVVKDLGWRYQELTEVERELLIEKIMDNLSVEAPAMGPAVAEQIVEIKYGDTDPDRALDFTEEVSRRWREEVLEATRKAKKRAFDNLNERTRSIEMRVQEIADEIAALMELHQIPPWKPDYRNPERPMAPEFTRLYEARQEQSDLQEEIEDEALEIMRKEARYERMPDTVPEVQLTEGNDLVREVAKRREKIIDLQNVLTEKGWLPTHSSYRSTQSKIEALEQEIAVLEGAGVGPEETTTWAENVPKIELGDEIEALTLDQERRQQKLEALGLEIDNLIAKTSELQIVYQELESLEDERERYNQQLTDFGINLQDMRVELDLAETSAGDPFVILDPVDRPTRPTEPDPILITVFSMFLGLAIGMGMAVVLEYSKSCFRNVNDVTRVMAVPVLGSIGAIVTTAQARRHKVVQRVLAASTIAFVAIVGYVTWAWYFRQDMLSDGLLASIERFRKSFE